MQIWYHSVFEKRFAKLQPKIKQKVKLAIDKFRVDPFTFELRNHALSGSMQGKRAFSVTGDMRVIFVEKEKYTLVLMLDVGTHNQVY